jgi:hypothetical protein
MSLSVEILHTGGQYARFVRDHLGRAGRQPVAEHLLPAELPLIVDDPDDFLPDGIGQGSIAIAINIHQDLLVELPAALAGTTAKALIAPIESAEWIRPGLVNQVTRECRRYGLESAFPKPFCALNPAGVVLKQFCEEYRVGRPQLALKVENGAVTKATVVRGSPCGLTDWVAERLVGHLADDHLEQKAAELLHLRPCLATQVMDPQLGDTVMHESIRLMEAAARRGLRAADQD